MASLWHSCCLQFKLPAGANGSTGPSGRDEDGAAFARACHLSVALRRMHLNFNAAYTICPTLHKRKRLPAAIIETFSEPCLCVFQVAMFAKSWKFLEHAAHSRLAGNGLKAGGATSPIRWLYIDLHIVALCGIAWCIRNACKTIRRKKRQCQKSKEMMEQNIKTIFTCGSSLSGFQFSVELLIRTTFWAP